MAQGNGNPSGARAHASTAQDVPSAAAGVEARRTLALIGPAATGKTMLAEALLVKSGALQTPGSVERGTTVCDFDPLEKKVRHSLQSALVHLNHRGTRIHLIDTPGAPDFIGQSLPALEAVDTAALVIDAQAGIEPQALRLMAIAAARRLDRLVIVNKIDAPGADLPPLLADLQAAFGRECLPLNLPARRGSEVADCFFAPHATSGHEPDFSSVEAAHRALVEQVVEVDAAVVERYLEDGDIDPRELHAPLEQALREGHLIPVCFVSARQGTGVAALLDIIVQLLPHPGEGNPPQFLQGPEAHPLTARPDPGAHVLAHVFKVAMDPYVGKMGILRVHQGTVTRDSLLYIGDSRKPFKVGHLFMLQGKEHVEVPRALPGDLVAVAKVDEIAYDAVLHDAAEDTHIHLAPLPFPTPVHGLAIEPKRRGDEQRLWDILSKLVAEDPCLRVEQRSATHDTVVYGLGELHLRMLLERLAEVHRFEVLTHVPRIAYRETITGPAQGHHRHKKQSGGAGQFGEVMLRVEPLPRGAGFEFVDAVKGGALPGAFMPAVEKGVRQAMEGGVVAGHPLVDLRVTVFDGKHHSVDSKEVAFITAGRKALVDAVKKAGAIVLEPIAQVEITAPAETLGDVTGDLSSKRAEVNGTTSLGFGQGQVRAHVPLAELASYQSRLNSLTSGQGRYTLAMSHYDAVPPSVQQALARDWRPHDDE